MKVLIQDCHSDEYFAGENAWAREPERALAFASSLDAAEFIREKDLHHAKVVLKFPEPRYDMEVAKTADC